MRVEILVFAVLRERIGQESVSLDLPPGSTVADLRAHIGGAHPAIAPLLGRVQVAVNRAMAKDTHQLSEGDEIALIPPVSGGSGPRRIAISAAALSLDEVVAAVAAEEHGAVVTFIGQVRRKGQLPSVVRLEYEAYAPMAEAVLAQIADELALENPGVRVAIHHRTGSLAVGEVAVVIAVAAAHRAEAFGACRVAIERLKQRAPIWKKEVGADGAVWVGMGP